MADLAENLRTFLLGDASIAAVVVAKVHQSTVPADDIAEAPYIWYRRSTRSTDRTLDAAPGDESDEQGFDVECVSTDCDQSQDLAELVRARLDNYRGAFGTDNVQGVFVQDQDDDYVSRGTQSEDGLHVAALAVQIFA